MVATGPSLLGCGHGAVDDADPGDRHRRSRRPSGPSSAGWDGITFTDSQNLVGDPFVAVALAAARDRAAAVRDRRHQRVHPPSRRARHRRRRPCRRPRAAASCSASAAATPRCSTSAASRCRSPTFAELVTDLQTYLASGTVDCDGHPSRLQWLDRARQPKVPLDIAASGPRVHRLRGPHRRARHARGRRRSRARRVGARPRPQGGGRRRAATPPRSRSAPTSTSAAIPTSTPPAALISGGVAAFAHFSSMPGSTGAGLAEADRAVVAEVGRRYDSNEHLQQHGRAHRGARRPSSSTGSRSSARPSACVDRLARAGRPRHRALRRHRRELRRRPRRTPAPPTELLDDRGPARRCESEAPS